MASIVHIPVTRNGPIVTRIVQTSGPIVHAGTVPTTVTGTVRPAQTADGEARPQLLYVHCLNFENSLF